MAEKSAVTPPREHIFPATRLTEVCLRWKDLTAKGQHGEAFKLLEQIIIESTPMFERLALFEGYQNTVDLPILIQAAREKVPRWLIHCDVKRLHEGKLFSWFSTCAKNAFRSEVAKQRQHSNRYHATSDSLEKFVGSEDHAVDMHDVADEVARRVQDISVRWGDPHELGAVRFIVDCITDNERQPANKTAITDGARFAYGLSEEIAKFFYQWALFAVRDALYDKVRAPFTKQDVLRNKESYTFIPDVIDIVGWDRFCELVIKLGGQRIKLPTVQSLARDHDDYLTREELDKTDLTPEAFEGVAKRRGKTTKNANEIYEQMSEYVGAHRSGEHPLYQEGEV